MSLMDTLGSHPLQQLGSWLAEAERHGIAEPIAMTLATATSRGEVTARIVLCKEITDEGIIFYTNYESDKARSLLDNPRASAVFYWQPLGRQVRLEGRVAKVARSKSEAYFATRPRESQIGAWASQQSRPCSSFAAFGAEVERVTAQFANQMVPCPPHWGGYLLVPGRCEFWLAAVGRLHDRVAYIKNGATWERQQVFP